MIHLLSLFCYLHYNCNLTITSMLWNLRADITVILKDRPVDHNKPPPFCFPVIVVLSAMAVVSLEHQPSPNLTKITPSIKVLTSLHCISWNKSITSFRSEVFYPFISYPFIKKACQSSFILIVLFCNICDPSH